MPVLLPGAESSCCHSHSRRSQPLEMDYEIDLNEVEGEIPEGLKGEWDSPMPSFVMMMLPTACDDGPYFTACSYMLDVDHALDLDLLCGRREFRERGPCAVREGRAAGEELAGWGWAGEGFVCIQC